uniref:Serine/threonine kinase 19 n=1 Tax=Chrysemys picta bellii TaxID=8478 RepID=A0A8C3F375_CHRPI
AEDQLRGEGDDRDGPAGGSLCANPPVPPQPHGAPPPADLQHPEGQEAAAAAGTRPWGCRRTGQTGGPRGGGFGSPVSCFPLPSPAVRGCAAPPVLKHQLYSLVRDRTAVDRQLSRLKDEGLIRLFQLGFDSDVFGVAFTQDYTAKVLQSVAGKEHAGTVRRFLETAFASCPELSYDNGRMLRDFGFRDPDITQLVNAGVLTVRDAGSWWLAVPGAGRFVKCFIKGLCGTRPSPPASPCPGAGPEPAPPRGKRPTKSALSRPRAQGRAGDDPEGQVQRDFTVGSAEPSGSQRRETGAPLPHP